MSWAIILAWIFLLLRPAPVLGVSFDDLGSGAARNLLGQEPVYAMEGTCRARIDGEFVDGYRFRFTSATGGGQWEPDVAELKRAGWTDDEIEDVRLEILTVPVERWGERAQRAFLANAARESQWVVEVGAPGAVGRVITLGGGNSEGVLLSACGQFYVSDDAAAGLTSGSVTFAGLDLKTATGVYEIRGLVTQGLPVPLAVALAMTGFGVSRRLFYEIVGGEAEFQAAERRRELELMGHDESSYERLGLAGAIVAGEATEEEVARFRELEQEAASRQSLRKKAGAVLRDAEPVSEPSAWDREDARSEDFRRV